VLRSGSAEVDIWQTDKHQFHDPSSISDSAQLRMDTVQEQVAITLLRLGVKPHQVCVKLNSMCWRTSGSKITAAEAVTAAASRIHFSNARNSITKDQIYALRKRVKRQAGWGLTHDVHAVAALVPELERHGCLGLYRWYKQATTQQGEQPLIIILQTAV
jgi:hypothetical protein